MKQGTRSNFRHIWLARFNLDKAELLRQTETKLKTLPFLDSNVGCQLVSFLFDEVPTIYAAGGSETQKLCEAYGWLCLAFWECDSLLPSFAENYASYVKEQLLLPEGRRDVSALVLAELLNSTSGKGECGLNRLILQEPDVIRASEKAMIEGRYETYLLAKTKYAEYENRLKESVELKKDWAALKGAFGKFIPAGKIIRRSLLPERNFQQGSGATFSSHKARFQASFDLFCWKYYLWGMKGDQPLLIKPAVVFTPFGTQIFIPGYLSFDPKRDLNLKEVTRLHRARGVPRQGEAFQELRDNAKRQKAKAIAADKEARGMGLKGVRRMEYVAKAIGNSTMDERAIRRLLKQ